MSYPAGPSVTYIFNARISDISAKIIARELSAIAGTCRPNIIAFDGQSPNANPLSTALEDTLLQLGLQVQREQTAISAETVILHTPLTLANDGFSDLNIVTRNLIVVADECFFRPGGVPAFDVDDCLSRIDHNTLALRKTVAPVSPACRASVKKWLARGNNSKIWSISPDDWLPICDFELQKPGKSPRDRRARRSPPDLQYFPNDADLALMFPSHAEKNTIVGAQHFGPHNPAKPFWNLSMPDNANDAPYFGTFDFMVYFTSPNWCECFSYEVMRTIAAGKLVISDAETAIDYNGAIFPATPGKVDGIIAGYIADPESYTKQIIRAQQTLQHFTPERFRSMFVNACAHKNPGTP